MGEFYAQVSSLSFTLLGIWFAVVQLTHRRWLRHLAYRRMVAHQALYYLAPGLFSLSALAAADEPLMWQVSFAVISFLGAAEAAHFLSVTGRMGDTPLRRALRTPLWAPPAYLPVALFAVFAGLPALLGLRSTWLVFTELAAGNPGT